VGRNKQISEKLHIIFRTMF